MRRDSGADAIRDLLHTDGRISEYCWKELIGDNIVDQKQLAAHGRRRNCWDLNEKCMVDAYKLNIFLLSFMIADYLIFCTSL